MVTEGLVFNSVYYSFLRPYNKHSRHSFNIFFNNTAVCLSAYLFLKYT